MKKAFQGFDQPNYTMIPDIFFDEVMPDLSGNELKILLYIMRRTFGFGKQSDAISLRQFREGIVTHDGRHLDRGSGVRHNRLVLAALDSLEQKGLLQRTRRTSTEGDADVSLYQLRFRGADTNPPASGGASLLQVTTVVTPGNDGLVTPGNTQYTVIQYTDLQETESQEREKDDRSGSSEPADHPTSRASDSPTMQKPSFSSPKREDNLMLAARPISKPKKSKQAPVSPEEMLAEEDSVVQQVVAEWRAIFKRPVGITPRLLEAARVLASFQPEQGEIARCRLWMYERDASGFYRKKRGGAMTLSDVAREFEAFRAAEEAPRNGAGLIIGTPMVSSFDDPNFHEECYPSEAERRARWEEERKNREPDEADRIIAELNAGIEALVAENQAKRARRINLPVQ